MRQTSWLYAVCTVSAFFWIFSQSCIMPYADCPDTGTDRQKELGRLVLKDGYKGIMCGYLGQPYNISGNLAHPGIDYRADKGSEVYAPLSGEYNKADTNVGGNSCYVVLPTGKRLFFLHLDDLKLGYRKKGETIGKVHGDHVHVELRAQGYDRRSLVGEGSDGVLLRDKEHIERLTDDPSEVIMDLSGCTEGDYVIVGELVCDAELFGAVADRDKLMGNTLYPKGYPVGQKLADLAEGTTVGIISAFPNDSESRYTLKVKVEGGLTGYMVASCFLPKIQCGDRGAILSIHLSRPYEFEGDIDEVDKLIEKYQTFTKRFPESRYVPESLMNIALLDIYALQFVDKAEKTDRVIRILKNLDAVSVEFTNRRDQNLLKETRGLFARRNADFSPEICFSVSEHLSELLKRLPSSVDSF